MSPLPHRPRRLLAVLLAIGAATSGVVLSTTSQSQASVAVDQVYRVPDSGRFTVRGHGYGHGNGMSQYGARGAARQGLSTQQILDFYYPGTVTSTVTNSRIRVLVSSDTDNDTQVLPRSGLRLRDTGTREDHVLPTGLGATRWRLSADGANRNVVTYLRDGAWRAWSPGGSPALVGQGQFYSPDGPVTLVTPSGNVTYRGALRSAAPTEGSAARDTVNVVLLDDYVKGVLPAEMPPVWAPAAVRAQAVAARTYAVFDREAHLERYYQICDTTSCQVYRGTSQEHEASNAAAEATADQVRTYQGEPAFTQFSSSNGGWSSSGSFPYLVSRRDPYEAASGNPYLDWSVALSAARIQDVYPGVGRLLRVRVTRREGGGDWQGRVETLVLEGTQGNRTLSGDTFRSVFGLRSTYFRL